MAAEAEFKVPGELEDLELPRKDRYCVPPGGADLRDATSAALHDLLDGALSQLVDGEADALATEAGCFDCLYGFVRDFKYVPSDIKGRLLDVLQHAVTDLAHALGGGLQGTGTTKRSKAAVGAVRNAAAAVGDAVRGQAPAGLRNSFKMAVFLLFSAAWRAESVYSSARQNELLQPKVKAVGTAAARKKAAAAAAKEDGKFVWETAREEVLGTMALALTVDLQRLWNLGISDEAFASLFPRLAYKMLEVPATLRAKAARASALALIAVPYHAVSALAAPVGAAVLQLISDHEHLTSPMAEVCAQLAGEHRDTRLAAELLRESSQHTHDSSTQAAQPCIAYSSHALLIAPSTVDTAIYKVCALLPGVAHASVAVLLPHLGSEPYTLRSAVATCLASVVGAACEEDLRRRRLAENSSSSSSDSSSAEETEEQEEARREGGQLVRMEPQARVLAAVGRQVLVSVRTQQLLCSSTECSSSSTCTTLQQTHQPCACVLTQQHTTTHDQMLATDALLDVLEERVRDSSSYTRAAVLRAWCSLCERGVLPHARVLAAAKLGAARLRDKSALVRRAAVQLLGALLERNPYTGSLDPEPYSARCVVLEAQLAALPQPPLLTAEESAALAELESNNTASVTADADAAADGDAGSDVVADESSSDKDDNDDENS
eukprot:14036-Heterococcus_DN1.PRE.1